MSTLHIWREIHVKFTVGLTTNRTDNLRRVCHVHDVFISHDIDPQTDTITAEPATRDSLDHQYVQAKIM